MIRSIRHFLLFNLLLSLVFVTMLTVLGTLLLEHKDIQRHTDAELVSMALLFETMFSAISDADLKNMQVGVNDLAFSFKNFSQSSQSIDLNRELLLRTGNNQAKLPENFALFQFQIWDQRGHLLLKSKQAPTTPFIKAKEGFGLSSVENRLWRVYSRTDPKTGIHILVALDHKARNHLEMRIAEDYIFIVLLTSPILAILIWVIVGQGLNTVICIAEEVGHRAPGYLEPVDLKSAPVEIKPLVDELNYLFERLKDAFEREKRFAGDAAHELRTPLAAVKTQTQLALQSDDLGEKEEAMRQVIIGVDRCTHIIQQLLTLSRMVPEATLEDLKAFNLVQVAQEMVALVVPFALSKKIELEFFAPEHPILIAGSMIAIGILVRNLVDNAVRYTHEGSKVEIHLVEEEDTVTLKVIDDGPGIPEELRARVFERFFRMLGTQSSGSGLGLAIVQQIARLHRAEIELHTPASGQGLEVRVMFIKYKE